MSLPASPQVRDARNEEAFEAHVEHDLLARGGWTREDRAGYDVARALCPGTVVAFLRETQPDAWARLETIHGGEVEAKVIGRLVKELDAFGTLHVLRTGITDYGVALKLAYFRPSTALNPQAQGLYERNRLGVMRQVPLAPARAGDTVDLALFVNGLPTATAELKNPFTGQTTADAEAQYAARRAAPLLAFKTRALVHFAVDPERVRMTTRVAGSATRFLPFDRGHAGGAGNPPNPVGHRTEYLWRSVWARDSWLDLLHRFLHLEREERAGVTRETLIFPRYHQLDVVRAAEADVRADGAGRNYLVQHSAGSGKSNSIAWLAHGLARLYDASDHKAFDTVVVVTDRVVLDRQLQDTIYQFEQQHGVVVPITRDARQLAQALDSGARIVITTIQKFPFVVEHLDAAAVERPERRYAVIVDEAHSSQSGDAADALREVLGEHVPPETSDSQEVITATLAARRARQPNLSFFAFTATPKPKTVAAFGTPRPDGTHAPFHVYSMRQAIEERFILDVLRSYTTYSVFFELSKRIEDDPRLDRRAAAQAVARFVRLHPHNVAQKVEVIVEHFRSVVMHKIGGRAKAMVVTGSRAEAVRYKQEIDAYLATRGYTGVRALVAFSGSIADAAGVEQTESRLNGGLAPKALPRAFDGDDYRVLIVADKYQTGFDQPLLHTMYVDRKLGGVRAVQTLSRLNRTHPGKDDTFVLDFANTADEIEAAFAPFYDRPVIVQDADPNQLYDLRTRLLAPDVLRPGEVEDFAQTFFRPATGRRAADHARLSRLVAPAADRADALPDDERDAFKHLLIAFLRLYSFLSQVMPFQDAELEKLYAFGRLLARSLQDAAGRVRVEIGDDVALDYYRLQVTASGRIDIDGADSALDPPSAVGTGSGDRQDDMLSEIIRALNDRFGTDFTDSDRYLLDQIEDDYVADEALRTQARANTIDQFAYPFDEAFLQKVLQRDGLNREMVERLLGESEFADLVKAHLLERVYDRLNDGE